MKSLLLSYSWYELINPFWLIVLMILSYFYVQKIAKSPIYNTTNSNKQYFFGAIILFFLVKGTPLALIGKDYLFSAHVLQLSIMFFVVAPLLILGFPSKFYRHHLWDYKKRFTMSILGHPWVTAISFNGLLTLYFIPFVFNTIKANILLMFIAQLILMINALFMWWVIITPVPEVSKLSYPVRILYIFFTSLLLMPIGIYLLIIVKEHYPFYAAVAGTIYPKLTLIYDQQLAGGVLKIGQLGSYTVALLHLVLNWGRKEDEKEGEVEGKNIRVVQGIVIQLPENKK